LMSSKIWQGKAQKCQSGGLSTALTF